MAGIKNIEVYKGDIYEMDIWLKYYDENGIDQPVPLPQTTVAAQIRAKADSSTILATFDTLVVDSDAGHVRITLLESVTEALDFGRLQLAKCDVELNNNGKVTTYLAGDVQLMQDVTR